MLIIFYNFTFTFLHLLVSSKLLGGVIFAGHLTTIICLRYGGILAQYFNRL